jgi:uncharacterized oligopeptide transporter (OPT) family protein
VLTIAGLGGILGVLFSVPLRRFPYHRAGSRISRRHCGAEVLRAGDNTARGVKFPITAGLLGGLGNSPRGRIISVTEATLWCPSERQGGVDHRERVIDLILAAIIFSGLRRCVSGLPGGAAWTIGLLVGINMVFGRISLIAIDLAAKTVPDTYT